MQPHGDYSSNNGILHFTEFSIGADGDAMFVFSSPVGMGIPGIGSGTGNAYGNGTLFTIELANHDKPPMQRTCKYSSSDT